jgi:hypothetical protein
MSPRIYSEGHISFEFTREFKLEAVRLIKQRGVSYAQASEDLGVQSHASKAPQLPPPVGETIDLGSAKTRDVIPSRYGEALAQVIGAFSGKRHNWKRWANY